jgi:UPF0755 protein
LALLVAAGSGLGEWWFGVSGPAAASGDKTVFELDRGKSLNEIAKELQAKHLVRNGPFFALWVRLKGQGGNLKAGEYALPSHASMAEIMHILAAGKVILHRLTIPEGLTSAQVVRLVQADPVLSGAVSEIPPEGSLLPETYSFARGTSRDQILAQMKAGHDRLMAELWPKRAAGLPFKTEEQAVILASIVEKETGVADERPHVAAVFINRLKRGMLLQSDPTVIYGLTRGTPLGRGLKESELHRATPYNTYVKPGLPPTPIGNPGKASIEAVLHPADTKDLYFVADGSGGHVFARTLAQHRRNVRKWRRIERLADPPG